MMWKHIVYYVTDMGGWSCLIKFDTGSLRTNTSLYDATDWFCVVRICNSPMGSEKQTNKKKKTIF